MPDETVAVMATEAVQFVVADTAQIDYTPYLEILVQYSGYIAGFLLFLVVVVLCWFTYKFFRMFI